MMVFEDFVEIHVTLRNCCLNHAHTTHVMDYGCAHCGIQASSYVIHTVVLSSALKLAAVSKATPTSKISLWRVSLVDSAA